jgi:hypothetical protein
MTKCVVHECGQNVSREGHKLCFAHWKQQRDGKLHECSRCGAFADDAARACPACGPAAGAKDAGVEEHTLSSTKIGERFGLPARKVNLVLSELGWIEKYVKGWIPTAQGASRGAVRREVKQTGVPYVVWPGAVLESGILAQAIGEIEARGIRPDAPDSPPPAASAAGDFRTRFPPTLRAADGHMVRSRAEVLIDNWLYMQEIAHAYERRLPVEEDAYCDFYIPSKKVYVEYWGLDEDAKYAERKARKRAVYGKYGLALVELQDGDIANLDEELPKKLIAHGIDCS